METTLDSYMIKLQEIETVCDDASTTKIILETKINELNILGSQIDAELGTMGVPTTMIHLNKYTICQHVRLSSCNLQCAFGKINDVRAADLLSKTKNNIGTIQDRDAYFVETQNISTFCKSQIDSDAEMKRFNHRVEQVFKNL